VTTPPNRKLNKNLKDALAKKVLEKRLNKIEKADSKGTSGFVQNIRKNDNFDKYCKFELFSGYQQLQVMEKGGEAVGIHSPFFKLHEKSCGGSTWIDGKAYINFANYNYLGLANDASVMEAAKKAIDLYGTSVSASRIVSGERPIQQSLERALANVYDVDDCVTFVSGHATNVTTIGYLFGEKDLILHDALIHNSILQGIKLSGASRIPFKHNDFNDLDSLLKKQRHKFEKVLIVVEGIYSMDGDYPNLPEFIELKRKHHALLMVDEAHSFGVMGNKGFGIREFFNLAGNDVDIWMGTLSKALASCGGYIAGNKALVKNLRYSAPGFLYSVGISPPTAASALAALEKMIQMPEKVQNLKKNGTAFLEEANANGLDTGSSAGYSIIPIITRSSIKAARLANALFEEGINVQPIFYPAVEEKMARLRFFISAEHTIEHIQYTVKETVRLDKLL
jgi:8-amino-7-oxononanoate synthase